MFKKRLKAIEQPVVKRAAIDILIESHPWQMSESERAKMTISCNDTAYIPKVPKAGSVLSNKGENIQLMHNGLKVLQGGYYGDWMVNIIKVLKGHHEPQEEKAFYEVVERLKKSKKNGHAMIELGSFWAYYSLWYKSVFPGAKVVGLEPDPKNLEIGTANARLNSLDVIFEQAAAGCEDGKKISFTLDHDPSQSIEVAIRSVDSIVKEKKLPYVDILHMDVQGVELDALKGAEQLISNKRLRFLFVSTHHYMISKDILTHQKCLEFIRLHGGHLVAEHNILESYSGDGLIVASFDESDRAFRIETSRNSSQASLFRAYEKDLSILAEHIDKQ